MIEGRPVPEERCSLESRDKRLLNLLNITAMSLLNWRGVGVKIAGSRGKSPQGRRTDGRRWRRSNQLMEKGMLRVCKEGKCSSLAGKSSKHAPSEIK